MMEWLLAAITLYILSAAYLRYKPEPAGIHGRPPVPLAVPVDDIRILTDISYEDDGEWKEDLVIVDRMLDAIERADTALLDMFLLDLHGIHHARSRSDTRRLADAVQRSDARVMVITDPVNSAYRTEPNPPFAWLTEAGASLVETDLRILRHNNLLYAPLYEATKWLLPKRPLLNNPLREGSKVSPYAISTAIAAKGNHRKVLVTKQEEACEVIVASANMNDLSAHFDNIAAAVRSGPLCNQILSAEFATAQASGMELEAWSCTGEADGNATVTALMGPWIASSILEDLKDAGAQDVIVVGVLFLTHRPIIDALVDAHDRGVQVHIVLDTNDASFGQEAGGFPNRVTAAELLRRAPDMDVRWHRTAGEFHSKFVLIKRPDDRIIHLGSANLTRRSLIGTNLETNLRLQVPKGSTPASDADSYAAQIVSSACSVPAKPDAPLLHRIAYHVGERTGMINC